MLNGYCFLNGYTKIVQISWWRWKGMLNFNWIFNQYLSIEPQAWRESLSAAETFRGAAQTTIRNEGWARNSRIVYRWGAHQRPGRPGDWWRRGEKDKKSGIYIKYRDGSRIVSWSCNTDCWLLVLVKQGVQEMEWKLLSLLDSRSYSLSGS